MQSGCKWLLSCFMIGLLPIISHAKTTTCPPLELIQRTPGQNGWNALPPGWDGRFESPQLGQGYSTKVARFNTARWVKLNNLPDGPGKIECDYDGNYDNELIRFDQASYFSTPQPQGEMWICKISGDFPAAVCECSMGIDYCAFESDAHEINTTLNVEDNLKLLDQEYHK